MKVYRAAICEDESVSLTFISKNLAAQFEEVHLPVILDNYSHSVDLQNAVNNAVQYDLLFLDIDMPQINGIELCRRFRNEHIDALVVFISTQGL